MGSEALPYFAYGSNMVLAQMARRCPGARLIGPAVLRRHRFAIFRAGYATLVPARNADAWGVLWRLTPRHVLALDGYEAVAQGEYRRAVLPVEAKGRTIPALLYLANDRTPGRPRRFYMAPIVAAAEAHGFPPETVRGLRRWLPLNGDTRP